VNVINDRISPIRDEELTHEEESLIRNIARRDEIDEILFSGFIPRYMVRNMQRRATA
jgi:hypothetical protein